ncbi:MAG: type II toxin-antitoxin system RelB/DinJ family antitoxin [Algicola sp.]|nr:type II toxin-antitoxin system RelB/DinJ family antitoxin [Algicola sp.]
MKTDMITVRINHDIKVQFADVCEDIGLTPSQAIKLFTKAVINYGGIPFELKRKQPNLITQQAMKEVDEGKLHKANSTKDLFETLGVDINDA